MPKIDTIKVKYAGDMIIDAIPNAQIFIYGYSFLWDGEEAILEIAASERKTIEAQIKSGRPFKIMDAPKKPVSKPTLKSTGKKEVTERNA
jgi:hypothetical protein